MKTTRRPYLKNLGHRGFVQGCTVICKATNVPLCHFFGGLRYALAPSSRWRKAQGLPLSYSYGTKEQPGLHHNGAGVCPQPGFRSPPDDSAWTEDCFQCNIWVPVGEPPIGGWPVLVYIHGGWLQFGSPNTFSAAALLGETDFKAVVIMPAYRLNVFGFLYSSELAQDAASVDDSVGNYGLWDQRLALEWTAGNVSLFGGNPKKITLSGYSAGSLPFSAFTYAALTKLGAYSTFHQLVYDLSLSDTEAIISQACIWSNGPGVQPKSPADAQKQFAQLLSALNIPAALPPAVKLQRLREVPFKALVQAASSIELHQFRPITDSSFIKSTLMGSLYNGTLAQSLARRKIRILLGECRDEHFLYGTWYPPSANTFSALRSRLIVDYPRSIVDAILPFYVDPSVTAHPRDPNWAADTFGRIYADMQVHILQRGLIHSIISNSPGSINAPSSLYRYRIEFRAGCVDDLFPVEWGATHATDMALWFFGNGATLSPQEREIVKAAILDPFCKFVNGKEVDWGTAGPEEIRVLKSDGSVVTATDELWENAIKVWEVIKRVQLDGPQRPRI